MSGFGNNFKSARETKNLTLEEIAQETRISARFLRAIEEETFDVLPGGIFNRGFVRTYASHVDIDPEQAVSEYKDLTQESNPEESESTTNTPLENSEGHLLPIAVGSLVVLIVLFYVFAWDTGTPTEAAVPQTAEAELSRRVEATPIPDTPTVGPTRSNTNRATLQTNRTTSRNETASEVRGVNVQIEVHEETWVSVESDGEAIVEGVVLGAGTTRRYSAREALEMTIGNAAGLTLSINGREVPSLGRDGQVRILTITPNRINGRLIGS